MESDLENLSSDIKIAAAYIRVSDDRQDEYSPDSQLKLIRDFAKRNNRIIPEDFVFYDDGISAKNAKNRTQFNQMIALAKDKDRPFDIIYVWKFSRFARNQEESIVYKSLLKKNGVSVISVSEPISDNAFGTLIERIIEWMDEYYLIRLSGEVKRGMLEKATRGEAMSRQFGYDIRDKVYVPNSDAETVRKIFIEYTEGKGMRTIAKELADIGVRTYRGNVPDNRFVEYILRNPVYIGKIRWSTEGKAASRRDFDNDSIVISKGKHDAIISEELWSKAQERIGRMKKLYPKYQRKEQPVQYALKGLLRCSACGSTLVWQSAGGGSLQCCSYARGVCRVSHSIQNSKAEKAVADALASAFKSLSFDIAPSVSSEAPAMAVNYEKLIHAEKRKLERVAEAYENGIDSLQEYNTKKSKITASIRELEKRMKKEFSKSDYDIKALSVKVKRGVELLTDPSVDARAKNENLRSFIEKIIFDKPNNELKVIYHI